MRFVLLLLIAVALPAVTVVGSNKSITNLLINAAHGNCYDDFLDAFNNYREALQPPDIKEVLDAIENMKGDNLTSSEDPLEKITEFLWNEYLSAAGNSIVRPKNLIGVLVGFV